MGGEVEVLRGSRDAESPHAEAQGQGAAAEGDGETRSDGGETAAPGDEDADDEQGECDERQPGAGSDGDAVDEPHRHDRLAVADDDRPVDGRDEARHAEAALGQPGLHLFDDRPELDAQAVVGQHHDPAPVRRRRRRHDPVRPAHGRRPRVREGIGLDDAGHRVLHEVAKPVSGGLAEKVECVRRASRKAEARHTVDDAARDLLEVGLLLDRRHGLVDHELLDGGLLRERSEHRDEAVLVDQFGARPRGDDRDGHEDRRHDDAESGQGCSPPAPPRPASPLRDCFRRR